MIVFVMISGKASEFCGVAELLNWLCCQLLMQAFACMGVEFVFSWREVGARGGFMGVTPMQHYVRAFGILNKFIGRTRIQLLKIIKTQIVWEEK